MTQATYYEVEMRLLVALEMNKEIFFQLSFLYSKKCRGSHFQGLNTGACSWVSALPQLAASERVGVKWEGSLLRPALPEAERSHAALQPALVWGSPWTRKRPQHFSFQTFLEGKKRGFDLLGGGWFFLSLLTSKQKVFFGVGCWVFCKLLPYVPSTEMSAAFSGYVK